MTPCTEDVGNRAFTGHDETTRRVLKETVAYHTVAAYDAWSTSSQKSMSISIVLSPLDAI